MLPLQGIRVVEIAQNLAGPYCAEILAHLGADVIKVERPEGGDDTRGWGPPFLDGAGSSFHAVNLGKRSVAVDLKDAAGVARLRELIDGADIVVQNLRPGSVEALGLDGPTLMKRNPRLIYCSLRALGSVGPLKDRPGFEPMVQAFSGMMMMSGQPDGPPIRIGTQVLDHGTGMWAAIGVLAALVRRSATGKGGTVDTSLFETALGWWTIFYASYALTGEVPPRHPTGSPKLIVFQGFESRNGPLVIAAGQRSPVRQARRRARPRRLGERSALREQCRALRASRRDPRGSDAHRRDAHEGRMDRHPGGGGRALRAGQHAARNAGRAADRSGRHADAGAGPEPAPDGPAGHARRRAAAESAAARPSSASTPTRCSRRIDRRKASPTRFRAFSPLG